MVCKAKIKIQPRKDLQFILQYSNLFPDEKSFHSLMEENPKQMSTVIRQRKRLIYAFSSSITQQNIESSEMR